eukprot:gene9491-6665_t
MAKLRAQRSDSDKERVRAADRKRKASPATYAVRYQGRSATEALDKRRLAEAARRARFVGRDLGERRICPHCGA